MDLAEFLLARIAEDEAAALAAEEIDGGHWFADGGRLGPGREPSDHSFDYIGEENAQHAARWDPARVLAEGEAKRKVIEELLWIDEQAAPLCGWAPTFALEALAVPYADHPDYDPAWSVETRV